MSYKKHVSYQDCILGKIGAPSDPKQKTVYQIMMITCMVTVMVTFNWLVKNSNHSLDHFIDSLYLYPLTFGIAVGVRFLVANPTIDKLIKKFIVPRYDGATRAVLATLLNVVFSSTINTFIIMTITNGGLIGITPDFFLVNLFISYSASFMFNYFLVGPAVKKLFEERVRHHIPKTRHAKALSRWF